MRIAQSNKNTAKRQVRQRCLVPAWQEKKKARKTLSLARQNFHYVNLTDVAVDGLGDLIFGHSANDLLDHLTILENQQSRNAADVVTSGGVHRFVDVQLGHFQFSGVVVRDFCDHSNAMCDQCRFPELVRGFNV